MTHNITPEQQVEENKNLAAARWAWKIMTKQLRNAQAKAEIFQSEYDQFDMEDRVRRYIKAGLVKR